VHAPMVLHHSQIPLVDIQVHLRNGVYLWQQLTHI
jgi:hypothetical protein